ncbi:hypothetical protein TCCBUS3UF1_4990 [Thermus sp. CCB_US3_UF1]|uniref:hypothetical protein n=1 Tax=unclassified Thermus TaxID=2619321 RepID=UPI0002389F43|nr:MULTISPECIES: hypothetical protein [unclassified Thermus]AEV15547.1 hypothetical protein TCCBUS3UF1_4990 [Thermus sp. CCB_US3_UF1]MCX7849223.1 hypothetical protein [Thermus sp.]
MKGLKILLGLGMALAFAACGTDVFFQQPYRVLLEPTQLGYEVDDQGRIIVVGNNAYVQAAPGAPGGYLERYEYLVVDDSGNEVFSGSSLGSGFVGVEVPPGREEANGQVTYAYKQSRPFSFSLDGRVALEHLNQNAPLNWRYQVTWYLTTANGRTVTWLQEYQVKYPLRGQ